METIHPSVFLSLPYFYLEAEFYLLQSTSNCSGVYILFQNGHHFSVLLFTCKLALVTLFIKSKFKRIFSFKLGIKG